MAAMSKSYIMKDGSKVQRLHHDTIGDVSHILLAFADGTEIEYSGEGESDRITACFAWHGRYQKLGDTSAGKDVDEAIERTAAVIENCLADQWVAQASEAGPRATDLSEALVRVAAEQGVTMAPERAVEIVSGWSVEYKKAVAKEKGAKVDGTLICVPEIYAALQTIKAERAAARAAKAKPEAATLDYAALAAG